MLRMSVKTKLRAYREGRRASEKFKIVNRSNNTAVKSMKNLHESTKKVPELWQM